jgi:hypothetical protein
MTSRGVILEYIVLLVLVKVLVYSILLVKTQGMVLDLAEVLAKEVMGLVVVLGGLVLLRHHDRALDLVEMLAQKVMGLMVVLGGLVLLRHFE